MAEIASRRAAAANGGRSADELDFELSGTIWRGIWS
jgi:hypothetical protein